MATLEQIRLGIKTTIEAHISGLTVYSYVKGSAVGNCLIVEPGDSDFLVAMGRGTDTLTFSLDVLVPAAEWEIGQRALDEYLSGYGERSIRQVIFNNRTLGLPNTDAHVSGWSGYGGSREIGNTQHIGARLSLVVHTKGTA